MCPSAIFSAAWWETDTTDTAASALLRALTLCTHSCLYAEYYRNPLSSVKSLLDSQHKGHYMLFNLCSERQYKASKFDVEVACFPFEDHQVWVTTICSEQAMSYIAASQSNSYAYVQWTMPYITRIALCRRRHCH